MEWSQVLEFLRHSWFRILLLVWLYLLLFKGFGKEWMKKQYEWWKLLFVDDDSHSHPDAPSHKNAIMIALTVVFIILTLKKAAYGTTDDIPEIPQGWQLVLLAGLGIMAAKTGAQKLFENKWGNGNGNGNGTTNGGSDNGQKEGKEGSQKAY